jgi:arylsulfatase A-like enzyme
MAERPNIVLITTDQQRFDTIAALGNQHIYTPHLDWLTDEGVTFTRAYADCPICMPSRATMMTGKTGYNSGLIGNKPKPVPMQTYPTLPGLLTQAGYQTRAQGKMHFHPMRANYGFEHMELPLDYYRERSRCGYAHMPKEHGVGENEVTPVISTVHESESLTHWTVRRSIDFIETRDETRPFFLWTSFTKPHPPLDPCANYWALYDGRPVPAPVHGEWSQDRESMPQGFLSSTYVLNNIWRMSEAQIADVRRAYYACITQIDYQLGLLIARLREMELLDNTWIVFTSDHGDMLGDHHMGAKSVLLEGSAHVPMIVRPPASRLRGTRVDRLAQVADVMPTILAAAGVQAPGDQDGVDLMTLVDGGEDRTFYGCCGMHFGVIDGPWKYTWCGTGDELMFNLAEDPMEQNELIRSGQAGEQLQRLRALLIERMTAQGSEHVKDGELVPGEPIGGPEECGRWPGFHTTGYPCDVLH